MLADAFPHRLLAFRLMAALPFAGVDGLTEKPETLTPPQGTPIETQKSILRIVCAGGFRVAMEGIADDFAAQSGISLDLTFGTPTKTRELLTHGLGFDAVVVTKGSLNDQAAAQLARETTFIVAKSPVGIGVREGIPVTPIESVDQFANLIRSLRSVGLSDPAAGTNLGNDILNSADRVGIGPDLRSRVKFIHGPGSVVSAEVAKGDPDAVITLISEITTVKGVQFVGNIPREMGLGTPFVAAVARATDNRPAAETFLEYLRSETARTRMRRTGLVIGDQ
jgi:molybdate transport system substrate-binding protein